MQPYFMARPVSVGYPTCLSDRGSSRGATYQQRLGARRFSDGSPRGRHLLPNYTDHLSLRHG
jgi:hypothetical protein